jgi:chromosome segregation ATPase
MHATAHSKAEKLAAELETVRNTLAAREKENKKLRADLRRELGHEHELEDERDAYIATHHLSDKDVANLMRELGTKKEELAKELEKSMQRDFELRRLQANLELTSEELNAAKSTIIQKDEELLQRSLEDKELEHKILALQVPLEQAADMYHSTCAVNAFDV